MNRRGFLQIFGAAAVGLAVPDLSFDPERALWVPGAKTFFLPEAITRPNPNLFLTPNWMDREALKVLEDKLILAKMLNRDYDEQWTGRVPKPGFRVSVRLPNRFGPDGRPLVVLRPGEEFITVEPRSL